ncbi:DUF4350 domain-containing protein [Motiliproteus sp. MSK22-1]|uniref:DUF4350 domain-containing protein n=1 Tax=Motiliproteus sp. MSK22-1 TaxID=1897630 RepID=UPI0009779E30|nr:DUF4350 domain-containing protein [Motiliproteus sp. MSK22-1]OMH39024.1 hypothetical protein BGP75_04710 [Motiliproteus sp. MSK22-1]
MKKLLGLLALVFLVFSGLALWNAEWKEIRYDAGPSKEAGSDPFFAIIRYLEQQDIDADTARSLAPMKAPDFFQDKDAVVLLGGYGVLAERQLTDVLDWVRRGGHLILSPENARPGFAELKQDLLFEQLGVALELGWRSSDEEEDYSEYQESSQSDSESETSFSETEQRRDSHSDAAEFLESDTVAEETVPSLIEELASFRDIRRCDDRNPVQLALLDSQQDIELEFRTRVHLSLLNEQQAYRKVVDSRGLPVILQFDQGRGKVTLLSDGGIWTNSRVACRDHAFFLEYLLGEQTKVFFLLNRKQASLSELLFFYLPELVTSLLLMLVFWLWRRGVRLGPADQHRQRFRRHFFEHLQSSARFRFRAGHHSSLLAPLRDDIRQRAIQRLDGFRADNQRQHYRLLAEHTGVPEGDIQIAMESKTALSATDFQSATRILKQIRESL